MRLDKYLSYALNITRSEVNPFIKKNEILVNGKRIIKKDFKIDEDKDEIVVNGNKITYKKFVYYMLNKPAGLVCSTKGYSNNTIYDLFEDSKYELSSIGRLDKDTEGLLIITNDGALNHFLTSPSNHIDKVYYVEVDKDLNEDEMKEFENGIIIRDGSEEEFKTEKAKIEKIDNLKYHVCIHEGKFHQIKRMFAYFNVEVRYLKRISFGDIKLDDKLEIGKYRELNDEELFKLKEKFNEK
ncbi:MAG: rRNA pseudouridine synthase [Bacilli bacterium]|nr:rRNA pseudouridine synthase [Bacilli bacterium]